jgi:hypothetical protein
LRLLMLVSQPGGEASKATVEHNIGTTLCTGTMVNDTDIRYLLRHIGFSADVVISLAPRAHMEQSATRRLFAVGG